MKAIRTIAITSLLLAGARLGAQQAGETVTRRGTITEDLYLFGGAVDVRADLQGDVAAFAGTIVIGQRVTGDVLATGGDVRIEGEILDDVRIGGGNVVLAGRVGGDAIALGGAVSLERDATVGGRAWFAGGDINVAGRIVTHLKAGGEKITLSGSIDGDVDLAAEEIVILPATRVAGKLTYRSRREARIEPGAQIAGGVTRLPLERGSVAGRVAGRLLFIAAAGALGAGLILLFPGFALGTIGTLSRDPLKSVGLGAGALVGLPAAAIVLMVTVVGLAAGAALLVVYGLALAAGCLAGALYGGDAVLRLLRRAPTTTTGETIAALLLGMIGLSLVALVPVVGGIAAFAVLLFGLGALLLTALRAWRTWRAGTGRVGMATAGAP